MSDHPSSRFTSQNKTTQERISNNTVGLVHLSDFRKRRADVLEQQEREDREAASTPEGVATPERSAATFTATPNATDAGETEKPVKKKKKGKITKALLSFHEEEIETEEEPVVVRKAEGVPPGSNAAGDGADDLAGKALAVDAATGILPRIITKTALRREAAEREALRKEFLAKQAAVKATEVAIPFVFYDGTNTPGGTVRVKKGDLIWLFLNRGRKVGAELGVGRDKSGNARKEWARVGVDDLMLVRGSVIIPHHYEFYFFIINKSTGPGGVLLFNYSAETARTGHVDEGPDQAGKDRNLTQLDISALEGASDDPTFTKVVDRRWYERNKHIYPASVWKVFDPEKDYRREVRRDAGGNTFFFAT